MRGLLAILLACGLALGLHPVAAPRWEAVMPAIPPGGFAKVGVEGVGHGDQGLPPDLRLRVRADQERTTILVKLNPVPETIRAGLQLADR